VQDLRDHSIQYRVDRDNDQNKFTDYGEHFFFFVMLGLVLLCRREYPELQTASRCP
jgi:hypothetical protein